MANKKVKELMEAELELISPDATLEEAARKMKECGCGFLPVGSEDSPEGIITDRDIVIRAVAEGKDTSEITVRECMTQDVCACREDDTLEDAARMMGENNVSRLVVKSDGESLCGVLTFGRMIRSNGNADETRKVVEKATGKVS
jgi:CBS domain-containing protein